MNCCKTLASFGTYSLENIKIDQKIVTEDIVLELQQLVDQQNINRQLFDNRIINLVFFFFLSKNAQDSLVSASQMSYMMVN